jgi:hypothetical protein
VGRSGAAHERGVARAGVGDEYPCKPGVPLRVYRESALWLCLGGWHYYVAPGVMRMAPRQRLLAMALEMGFGPRTEAAGYDPGCWSCSGPLPLTVAFQLIHEVERDTITLYDEHVLYPIDFNFIAPAWDVRRVPTNLSLDAIGPGRDTFEAVDLEHFAPRVRTVVTPESLMRTSLSVHLYGSLSKHKSPAPGSLVDELARSLTLRLAPPFMHYGLGATPGATSGLRAPVVHVVTPSARRGMPPPDRLVAWSARAGKARALALRFRAAGLPDVVSPHTSLRSVNAALAAYTGAADALAGSARGTLTVELAVDGALEASAVVQLVDLEASLTLCVLLVGGCEECALRSAAAWRAEYPSAPTVLVTGAPLRHAPAADARTTVQFVPGAGGDGGALRGACLSRAATEYVMLVGDDVEDVLRLRPDLLLAAAVQHRYDVVGPGGPPDAARTSPAPGAPVLAAWGQLFGVFDYGGGGVALRAGAYHVADGECRQVDFLPGAHLARRATLLEVGWDPELRGAGFVDWLLRARGGVAAAVCEFSVLRPVPPPPLVAGVTDRVEAALHEAELRDAADIQLLLSKRGLAHIAFGRAQFEAAAAAAV